MNLLEVWKNLDQNKSGKKYFNKVNNKEKVVNLIMLIMNNYQAKHYNHKVVINYLFHKRL